MTNVNQQEGGDEGSPSPGTSSHFEPQCGSCNLREICLPVGLPEEELAQLDRVVSQRRKVPQGQCLFRSGDRFAALYAVRSGFFKASTHLIETREQISGFSMAGELLGLDGISTGNHQLDVTALEDSEVCVIPYDQLEAVSRDAPGLQRQVHRVMSREIVREQGVMMLLGGMRAEERIAAFLLNLARRLQARGYSGRTMVLRMTREETGNYLGMTIETVSRTLSKMQAAGLVRLDKREVEILEPDRLVALLQR
ncbi:helix-turn-helix domain-containing protein [Aquincola sp. J276]|uniref:helix-turn-helix domain-containing protein n=1 Tax=Aquincola sp. J276 TaxID=2898432 RepID=UPI00215161AB|nr:helix-turn-helix domain-containing protein [Aquincola sp. J276]MCR5864057.1 helix-turn-helix domain-containing protein [Aquincola sp. J276]